MVEFICISLAFMMGRASILHRLPDRVKDIYVYRGTQKRENSPDNLIFPAQWRGRNDISRDIN